MLSDAGWDGLVHPEAGFICVGDPVFGDGGQNCFPLAASGTSDASKIPSPFTSDRQHGHWRFSVIE